MSDDLVKRLREFGAYGHSEESRLMAEAADEINRLRNALQPFADEAVDILELAVKLAMPQEKELAQRLRHYSNARIAFSTTSPEPQEQAASPPAPQE